MNKILKDFNDYKGLLIAGGTLLWWYFQVIGLWGVWLEYIRFFSSTQILSDWILWIITILFLFWIFELWKDNKWLPLTVLITSSIVSIFAFSYHYYSIAIFLWAWIAVTIINFLYIIFQKIQNSPKIGKIWLHIPRWVSLWIWIVLVLTLFWILSTRIGNTPSSLYWDDKVSSVMTRLGTWTKIQYFNDTYIFLVNDSDKIRKVKILKTEDFLLKY